MRKRVRTALIALFALFAAACKPQGIYTPEFLTDASLRMEVGKQQIFIFNPLSCQLACNVERKEFRMHTDTMSEYVLLTLSSLPSEEGEILTASQLIWTSPGGADETRKNIALEVVKLEGDIAWLWNSRESIRMTVRFR